jgi:3(or 17)beta-hydroxysteroid dehydrogenase
MGRVADKVVIVTGGASGIGEAEARMLAREGARVVVTDINPEAGRAVAKSIDALFVEQDVAEEATWPALIEQVCDEFGRLDGLVNNAGIAVIASVETTSTEIWRKVLAIHLDATFFGCKFAIPAMRKSGGGSIVNTSSTAALRGIGPYLAYSAAKGGIRSLTKSVAHHCKLSGYGIRCNSIHPGGIDTPLLRGATDITSGREDVDPEEAERQRALLDLGQPDDVANLVLYLMSDESRHVNAAELVIDNGSTAF